MRFSVKTVIKLLSTIAALLSSASAFAGPGIGTITVSFNASEAVPSLSGMMLVVLSLLLFAIAFRSAKQKQSNKLFVTLISTGALLTAMGGAGQIKNSIDVQAGLWTPTIVGLNQAGSTQNLSPGSAQYQNNEMGLTATITDITVTDPTYSCLGSPSTGCTVGTMLNPGASCELTCFNSAVTRPE